MINILSRISNSATETAKLAKTIGVNLRGGEVIELVSDLGGGKTIFTKGIAIGAGSTDKVHSPSFTIENEYTAGKLTIHHLDFYRLDNPGIMKNELVERLEDPNSVTIIEWADLVEDLLPGSRLVIEIQATGENSRQFNLKYPSKLAYLVKGLK